MNPKMTLHMANGARIVVELLPDAAPNAVNSLIHAVSHGWLDNHAIQRIVPGNWIDLSYDAFGREEAQYLIPNEFDLHPELAPLALHPGCVCMGGYGEAGLASCEIFFPLRHCPEHRGVYPVVGYVLEGMEELRRLEKVPTRPVDFPIPGVEVNAPLRPEIIARAELKLYGRTYPAPVRMAKQDLPPNWPEGERRKRSVLVAVDLQKDFIDGALGTPEAAAIVERAAARIADFPGRVAATLDTHGPDYLDTLEGKNLPVPHCVEGTDGWALDDRIRAALEGREKGWTAFRKPTFGSAELGQWLAERHREEPISEVVLVGLCTDICVLSNALVCKAFLPDVPVKVEEACCAGSTPAAHETALAAMGPCQIEVIQ